VQVRCNESLASYIGPEPCGSNREVAAEASVGVSIGQPLSHETVYNPGADVLQYTEGNTVHCDKASKVLTWRGRRTWHVQKLLAREPGDLSTDLLDKQARIEKARSRSQ